MRDGEKILAYQGSEVILVHDANAGLLPFTWMVKVGKVDDRDDGLLAVMNFKTMGDAMTWAIGRDIKGEVTCRKLSLAWKSKRCTPTVSLEF